MAGRARKRFVRESISNQEEGNQLSDLLGPEALNLLTGRGVNLIEQVGMDVVRDIILDIFIGKNLRDSTELVLGSLLSILGFRYEASKEIDEGAFWLSTQEDKRESDATLLYELGKGVRFDIGFIGRGNPEISLDKVTRYGREEEIQGTHWYMATIIIVDRLGRNSRVERMARGVGGEIVQMSAAFWPQVVARLLEEKLEGYHHELARMEQKLIEEYLRDKLKTVPLDSFIRNLPVADLIEQPELPLGMLEEEDEADLFK